MDEMNTLEMVQTLLKQRGFAKLRSRVLEMNPADIGAIMEELPQEELLLFFRLLPKELAAEAFVNVDGDVQEELIKSFSDREISDVMSELYVDDAVDMIEEMPANVVRRVLKYTDPDMRKAINEILQYPSDSAGSLMTTEYVGLKTSMTVRTALPKPSYSFSISESILIRESRLLSSIVRPTRRSDASASRLIRPSIFIE